MIKTYGTKSYIEWQALIHVGKAKVSIPFMGGAITPSGIVPATYTTNNKVLQKVIENSSYYKSGKIYLMRQIAEPEKEEGGKRKEEGEQLVSASQPGQPLISDKTASAAVKQVTVSDLEAAKTYLMENYGVRASDLRSKVAIVTQGKARNIEFVGLG